MRGLIAAGPPGIDLALLQRELLRFGARRCDVRALNCRRALVATNSDSTYVFVAVFLHDANTVIRYNGLFSLVAWIFQLHSRAWLLCRAFAVPRDALRDDGRHCGRIPERQRCTASFRRGFSQRVAVKLDGLGKRPIATHPAMVSELGNTVDGVGMIGLLPYSLHCFLIASERGTAMGEGVALWDRIL